MTNLLFDDTARSMLHRLLTYTKTNVNDVVRNKLNECLLIFE